MTEEQQNLLWDIGIKLNALAQECEDDDKFHNYLSRKNYLFTMSIDELGAEFMNVAEDEDNEF